MTELMSVEMPDEAAATLLARRLGAEFETEVARTDGRCELRISISRPSDQAVAELLTTVEAWLAAAELDSVAVEIAGRRYALDAR